MRKYCLVNPATGNCVGIFIKTSRVVPGVFRKLLINKFLPFKKPPSMMVNVGLSENQQQIAFCLLLGFHSRKEIAEILSNMTDNDYSETRIKNSLQALYSKFDCNTPGQLLNLITSGQINVEFPADVISEFSFPVSLTLEAKLPKKS